MTLVDGAGKKACVIFNPNAGRGIAGRLALQAASHLADHGWQPLVLPTDRAGHERDLAKAHRDAEYMVAVGGDGTLRQLAEGLGRRGREIPLGLVPVGNANVVARELQIPLRDRDAAIRLLTEGAPRPFDAGEVVADDREPELFLAMIGVGFDALTIRNVDAMRSTRVGRRAYGHNHFFAFAMYVFSSLPSFFRLLPTRVRVSVDGERVPGHWPTLWICNTRTYATGWSMTPAARCDDGILDHHLGRRTFAPWIAVEMEEAIRGRSAAHFFCEYGQARDYVIEADRPFHWQDDGDSRPKARRLKLSVLPGALKLVAPSIAP